MIRIVPATVEDVPVILGLIKGLAEYERLSHEVSATEAQLRITLFGERPAAEVLIAWQGAEAVGFALYFQNYSTFLALPGIYLEDIFVLPAHRGGGIGRQLLTRVAGLAVARGCGRLEWSVLDWNQPALNFYRKLGAQAMEEWTVQRVSGAALLALAKHE